MILTRNEILKELNKNIFIKPFDIEKLNSNSYNLSIADTLLVYRDSCLDMKVDNPVEEIKIPLDGYLLKPFEVYLASTVERTFSTKYIPMIEGRSSIARLGLFTHISAGLGEIGFDGHWTLELVVVKPLIIYPNIPICQIFFNDALGEVSFCDSRKYQNSTSPMPSKLYMEL